ncbi:DUF1212-domain-containing protein [Violaceomyces palustris]|uniref:DUF1212-domain-containing protein n=1 Tax=Violaceomyces palustris TaxID=1673888 RepID=A0ACD0NS18_9BASI|nr:DUF1212-domain-containing protein [Violaceomyces palustris]
MAEDHRHSPASEEPARPGGSQLEPSRPTTSSTLGGLAQDRRSGTETPGTPSGLAARRAGRVHFDGSSNPSSRRMNLQLGQPGGAIGPTVTARGTQATGASAASEGLSLSSVSRPNHPGPLNLASRLTPGTEAPAVMPVPSEAQQGPNAAAPVHQHHVPTLALTGAKGLDEQGLDNRAFLELQRELQRHEARSEGSASSWPDVGRDEVQGAQRAALEAALAEKTARREARKAAAAARRVSDTPGMSATASGASTPGWTTESSYDPANDSDLDHIDMIPGETDGMPSRVRKRRGEIEAEEAPRGWAKIRSLFGKPQEGDEEREEKGVVPHEEGGPTNMKTVPVETSSGLHSGIRRRPTKFEREAARLVKQHRLAQNRADTLDRINRSHLPDSEATTPDPQETSANLDARPVATGGVLGNLLKLYEQQQREQRQATLGISAGTSTVGSLSDFDGASSPGDGGAATMSELVAQELRRQEGGKDARGGGGGQVRIGGVSDSRDSRGRRKSWAPVAMPSPGIGQALTGLGSTVIGTTTKVVKGVANEAGFEDVMDERPKASRSGAGVFGALIATTGNLIGAVSPAHAQLGPNPKRPGFTLDRYLMPEMNAKTLKRTAQIVADAAPRPYRTSGFSSPNDTRTHSAPGSPGFMPKVEKNDSNETAVTPPYSGSYTPKKRASSIMMMPSRSRNGTDHTHSVNSKRGSHLLPGHAADKAWSAISKTWTGHSVVNTPDVYGNGQGGDYFGLDAEKIQRQEWQKKLKKRAKDKRKKEEIFITMHVAAILQRQEFILKLARALMMFGAPTHRIETQIQQTARVLEINCRCIYLPNLMLLAFGDESTHTSETKFIKQAGGLDLTKLTDMHAVYWNVIHDKIGVGEASAQLDELMRRKPLIGRWPMVFIGGFASAFICVGPQGFSGSFIDALAAFPLGMFLVFCQSIITTELYSNVFEIVFATLNSFVAAALQHTGYFCYSAVVSGSIVLILPGFIVLSGSLELQAKNLIAGSVRLVYAIIYSLFLGFGLSIGTSFWALFSGETSNSQQYQKCAIHRDGVWWMSDVGLIWALLTTPGYSIALSLRNQVKINRKEFPVMVLIACAGWACNHFAASNPALSGRQDITSALGSLCVGILANIYGRMFDGRSFVVSVPGILYQLPSGLSNGGLLKFADTTNSTSSYDSGFNVAQSLVEVALGLTVGLFAATTLSYMLGGRKMRNGGSLFSF